MELLILISANVLTAVIMYVIFSIRFSRALKASRKNEVMKELRDNVEVTIEFINTSIELMDRKNRAFYQLLERGEALKARLEGLGVAESPGKHIQRPTVPPDQRAVPAAPGESQAASAARSVAGSAPGSAAGVAPNMPREADGDGALERALGNLGSDRLELSAERPQEAGPLSRPVPPPSPVLARAAGMAASAGAFLRRMLGAGASQSASVAVPPEHAPADPPEILAAVEAGESTGGTSARPRAPADFAAMVDRELERSAQSAPVPPTTSARPRGDRYEPEQTSPAVAGDSVEISASSMGAADPPLLEPPTGPLPEAGPERTRFVHALRSAGIAADEIVERTGLGRAQVDLILALPVQSSRPRTRRNSETQA